MPEGIVVSLPYYYSSGAPTLSFLIASIACGFFQVRLRQRRRLGQGPKEPRGCAT